MTQTCFWGLEVGIVSSFLSKTTWSSCCQDWDMQKFEIWVMVCVLIHLTSQVFWLVVEPLVDCWWCFHWNYWIRACWRRLWWEWSEILPFSQELDKTGIIKVRTEQSLISDQNVCKPCSCGVCMKRSPTASSVPQLQRTLLYCLVLMVAQGYPPTILTERKICTPILLPATTRTTLRLRPPPPTPPP